MSEAVEVENNVEVNQQVNSQPEVQLQPETEPELIVRVCSHIKDDGIRCGTPALTGRNFCYYHCRVHHPGGKIATRQYRSPVPDSVASLQVALAHTMQALASGELTPKQANSSIYAIHAAIKLLHLTKPLTEAEQQQVVTEIPKPMQQVLDGRDEDVTDEAVRLAHREINSLRSRVLSTELEAYFEEMLRTSKGVDERQYQVAVNRIYEHDYAVKELKARGVTNITPL